ncbi:hypothetical protein ACFQ1I_44575 [Kitasatospora arboriphila]
MNAREWLLGAVQGERAPASRGSRGRGRRGGGAGRGGGAARGVGVLALAAGVAGRVRDRRGGGGRVAAAVRAATVAVAGLLGAAAWLVVTAARPRSPLGASRLVRSGVWTVSGVLALRGAAGWWSPGWVSATRRPSSGTGTCRSTRRSASPWAH